MAHYEKDGEYIRSLDFTDSAKVNLEPMYSYIDDDEDYEKNFELLYNLCPKSAKDFVNMIFLDTICFNMDRHTKKYGVLRNTETGKVIGLAPNFDNNIALISRGYPMNITRENDKLIDLFVEFISCNKSAASFYEEININIICDETIKEIIKKTGFSIDAKTVSDFILNGVAKIKMELV